jgi:hypothetical protein
MNDKHSLAEESSHSLSEESLSLDEGFKTAGVYSAKGKEEYESDGSPEIGHKTITLHGNLDKVFNGCLKVLKERVAWWGEGSEILKEESPQFIEAYINGSTITVETKQAKTGMVEIYFQSSDSWDSDTDRKNADKFKDLILAELG